MIKRVRAVLGTPDGCLLAIRRDRPDRATYWVLPGGHVDPGDQSLKAAHSREISEEIAGEADITSLLQVLDSGAGDERQYFYLGRIASWDFAARTVPEFSEPGRGTYQLEQIPLTAAGSAPSTSSRLRSPDCSAMLSPRAVTCSRCRICDPARRPKYRVEPEGRGSSGKSPFVRLSVGGSPLLTAMVVLCGHKNPRARLEICAHNGGLAAAASTVLVRMGGSGVVRCRP